MFKLIEMSLHVPDAAELRGRILLRPQSWVLPPSMRTVIRGPSGCGKSMLLRVMAGLKCPSAGKIAFKDQILEDGSRISHRRRVHLVDQSPLLIGADLRQVLSLGAEFRGQDAPLDKTLREELSLLGLGLLDLNTPPSSLSSGERMRVALLRGLLLNVECLLLDEPTTGLDDATAAHMIQRLERRDVPPIVSASHDPRWWDCCDTRLEIREAALHGC